MSLVRENLSSIGRVQLYWIYNDAVEDDRFIDAFGDEAISHPVVFIGVECLAKEPVVYSMEIRGPQSFYKVDQGEIPANLDRVEIPTPYRPVLGVKLTTRPRDGQTRNFSV